MKQLGRVSGWLKSGLLLGALAFAPRGALAAPNAADAPPTDKTLSPFFVVEGADPNVEALPLESTKVDVQVTGVIAEVRSRSTPNTCFRLRRARPCTACACRCATR